MSELNPQGSKKQKSSIPFLYWVVLFCFLLVVFRVNDYGASIDEPLFYDYSDETITVYKKAILNQPFEEVYTYPFFQIYGPAYLILGHFTVQVLKPILPFLDRFNLWHLANFITFLAGVVLIYQISSKFASKMAAQFAALLFLTQPLLWGQGVINLKDMPFLVFFLASTYTGMEMIDRLEMPLLPKNIISWRMPFNNKASKLILGGFVFWVVITIDRLTNNLLSYPFFSTIITQAFDAPAGSWLNRWFLKLTQHSSVTPLQAYIEKAQSMVSLIEFVTILFVGVLLLIWVVRKIKTNNRWFLAAGVLLGVTTAVRVLGPAVIGLIVFYIILRKKPQATIILFPYLFVAGIVTYISWPLLWNHPILNIAESLSVMSQFPWTGQVRFEGREFLATQLPWYYLPKLLSIQLTVPLLVLCGTGVGRSIYRFVRRAPGSKISLFLLSWMFLPIVGVILYRPAIYDNFRQFLFILPPFFVFAAIGFEWIIQFIPSKWTAPVFSIVLLLPGIVAGVWLHPYEYVYYNGLVGWTGNINRSFETDYWGTSLCEAARVISNHTSEAATVAVTDHTLGLVFKECASSQLSLLVERADPSTIQPDYSAILTRYDDDLDYFRSMRVITTIGRGNTPFAVVKKTP